MKRIILVCYIFWSIHKPEELSYDKIASQSSDTVWSKNTDFWKMNISTLICFKWRFFSTICCLWWLFEDFKLQSNESLSLKTLIQQVNLSIHVDWNELQFLVRPLFTYFPIFKTNQFWCKLRIFLWNSKAIQLENLNNDIVWDQSYFLRIIYTIFCSETLYVEFSLGYPSRCFVVR